MDGGVETALRYSLATLLALGGMRFYYEFVRLSALRDARRGVHAILGWLQAGFLPSFILSFLAAYWISRGTALAAVGDFVFWFTYFLCTLLVLASFARQAARRGSARPGDRPPVSPADPIAWLRRMMGEDGEGKG